MPRAPAVSDLRPAWRRFLVAASASVVGLALAACDDKGEQSQPQNRKGAFQDQGKMPETPRAKGPIAPAPPKAESRPPEASPGAAPGAARVVGTWTVIVSPFNPAEGIVRDDRGEGTTYRFEDGGKVTVAGSKQCTYALQPAELKIECDGKATGGKIEFPDDQTMVWTVEGDKIITLKKR